jgi:hypothetical protein
MAAGQIIITVEGMSDLLALAQRNLLASQQILATLGALRAEEEQSMAALDDAIAALQTEVTNNTNVVTAADTLINGIAAQIQTAVSAALAAGATPAQLAAISAVQTTLAANDTSLSQAVAANTTAAPAGNPAPTPTVTAAAIKAR